MGHFNKFSREPAHCLPGRVVLSGIPETGVAARSAASTAGSSGIVAIGFSSPISTGAAPDLYRLKTTWIREGSSPSLGGDLPYPCDCPQAPGPGIHHRQHIRFSDRAPADVLHTGLGVDDEEPVIALEAAACIPRGDRLQNSSSRCPRAGPLPTRSNPFDSTSACRNRNRT